MPQRFDLIVFDWDGTLIDSAGAIARCIQSAARDLGLPEPSFERASHVIGLGLQDALAYAVPELAPSDYGRMIDRYRHHFLLCDANLTLFDGSAAMLEALQARGHLLAIATGKSSAGLARALNNTALASCFVATRCADQTAPKPAPDMLFELMAELDVRPERALMIGDTTHDLEMAASAGVCSLGVCHGAHPAEQLATRRPLALLKSTAELQAWLTSNA